MRAFSGLSAFPITPASPDGVVDVVSLRRLVARLCAAKVDSIGVLGSTGSYPYLSRTERRRALEAAVEEANGRVPVLAGIGALRTDETVRLAQDAKAAGAQAGLLAAVSYTPLTEDEVFEHFVTVAGESGLPICIYDNPGTTHFKFSPALVGRLAQVPGVVAVKSPGAEPVAFAAQLAELRALVPADFALGASGDPFCAEALLAGADTWYSAIAGLFPQMCVEIARAAGPGDAEETRRLNQRLEPLWTLMKVHSGLRVIYASANLLGLTDAQPPRPILPLTGEAQRQVADMLAALSPR